jgi:hypothetical protein
VLSSTQRCNNLVLDVTRDALMRLQTALPDEPIRKLPPTLWMYRWH